MAADSSADKITSELSHLMGSLPPAMQALTGVNLAQVHHRNLRHLFINPRSG
jgi:hypothetical protein